MVEELTAQFRVCKHIKRDGNRCNSPAMTGMNFCFHHIGGKVASLVREGATCDAGAQLDFPYPADREAIQKSLHLVAQALREGKIDNKTANTYTRIFRLEEQNFHRWEKKQKDTGKTKMQPPSNAIAADTNTNNDVIPGGPSKPEVGLGGEQTIPPTDVIASEAEPGSPRTGLRSWGGGTPVEEPAFPTHSTTLVIPTEASKASEAEEPALSSSTQPTQSSLSACRTASNNPAAAPTTSPAM